MCSTRGQHGCTSLLYSVCESDPCPPAFRFAAERKRERTPSPTRKLGVVAHSNLDCDHNAFGGRRSHQGPMLKFKRGRSSACVRTTHCHLPLLGLCLVIALRVIHTRPHMGGPFRPSSSSTSGDFDRSPSQGGPLVQGPNCPSTQSQKPLRKSNLDRSMELKGFSCAPFMGTEPHSIIASIDLL